MRVISAKNIRLSQPTDLFDYIEPVYDEAHVVLNDEAFDSLIKSKNCIDSWQCLCVLGNKCMAGKSRPYFTHKIFIDSWVDATEYEGKVYAVLSTYNIKPENDKFKLIDPNQILFTFDGEILTEKGIIDIRLEKGQSLAKKWDNGIDFCATEPVTKIQFIELCRKHAMENNICVGFAGDGLNMENDGTYSVYFGGLKRKVHYYGSSLG